MGSFATRITSPTLNDYAHLPPLQMPEQHSAPVEQFEFVCPHVPACTAVGAVIEATTGTAMAAPMPTRSSASRREIGGTRGGANPSVNK